MKRLGQPGRPRWQRDAQPLDDGYRADDFARWVADAETTLARLLWTLECPYWRDPVICDPPVYYRLAPPDLAAIRAEVIRRIEAAGGRVELGATVATVAAGELRISMA